MIKFRMRAYCIFVNPSILVLLMLPFPRDVVCVFGLLQVKEVDLSEVNCANVVMAEAYFSL